MMSFTRGGRRNRYFQARTRTGWVQLCADTPHRIQANRIEAMWAELAENLHWDILDAVLVGGLRPAELYALHRECAGQVGALRRLLLDVDVEPLVAEFLAVYRTDVAEDTAAHVETHVRALVPAGAVFLRSRATPVELTQRLAAYPGTSGTRRKVHSAWSQFFEYCTRLKGLYEVNPMAAVQRPDAKRPAIRFYELDQVQRLVDWQPTPERRAFFALMYGAPADASTAVGLLASDLMAADREVRLAGTKTRTRDRVVRVMQWAWPVLWAHARTVLPGAPLWPGWSRWTVSDWHRETVAALKPALRLPLRNARHHWAVMNLRAGVPVAIVQQGLGHATAKLTLDTYGPWLPTGADRQEADRLVTQDLQRRSAAGGGSFPER